MTLADRYQTLQQHIADCATQAGRDPGSVHLLAVSKHQSIEDIQTLLDCGQNDFGENTIQEALPKIQALCERSICWHFIGRIQSNKCQAIAKHFDWVHGVTSLEIAECLDQYRAGDAKPLNICIQVNVSGEASKAGVQAEGVMALAQAIAKLPHLQLQGLMTMAPMDANHERCLGIFKQLAALQNTCQHNGMPMDHLSMGMSRDFEAAIPAGATWLRVGSKLFDNPVIPAQAGTQ